MPYIRTWKYFLRCFKINSIFYNIKEGKLFYLCEICFCVLCEVFIFCSQMNSELSQYQLLNNFFLTDLESYLPHILNWHIYIGYLVLFHWFIHLFLYIFVPFMLVSFSDVFEALKYFKWHKKTQSIIRTLAYNQILFGVHIWLS